MEHRLLWLREAPLQPGVGDAAVELGRRERQGQGGGIEIVSIVGKCVLRLAPCPECEAVPVPRLRQPRSRAPYWKIECCGGAIVRYGHTRAVRSWNEAMAQKP